MIDTRVKVYDYANGRAYELSDRGNFDYALSLEGDRLIVTQTLYGYGRENYIEAVGELSMVDGENVMMVTE